MSLVNDPAFFKTIAKMTLDKVYSEQKLKEKMKDKLIDVLRYVLESGEAGLTTRSIADRCDMSIYSARNWLMKLEESQVICRIEQSKKTLWYRSH